MFLRLKRNFSVLDSPKKRASARTSPMLHSSPLKKPKLADPLLASALKSAMDRINNSENGQASTSKCAESPIKAAVCKETCKDNEKSAEISRVSFDPDPVVMETPPSSPPHEKKHKPRVVVLKEEKESLERQISEADAKIAEKFNKLREVRANILNFTRERLELDDKIAMANDAQHTVRNYLNSIYNPGKELAKSTLALMEDCRRNHTKKLDKLQFEFNDLFETTSEAIKEQKNDFLHEIELHERTLATIECQKQDKPAVQITEIPQEDMESGEETKDRSLQESSSKNDPVSDKAPDVDDDCIVLDRSNYSERSGEENSCGQDQSVNIGESKSKSTDSRDDATEIDDAEDDSTFTPLQAQRPVGD